MANGAEKVTISLPRNLIELTDEIAKERNVSRSKVVSACLQELADKRLREEMEEGYKALGKEHLKFAEDSIHLANEILSDWE